MQEPISVYWRPHCSSCQKVKEFLSSRGVAFESVNVEASPAALEKLRALGVRGVPVVMRGVAFVYAQLLPDVAAFVGIAPPDAVGLSTEQLVQRMDAILAAAATLVRRVPAASFDQQMPERRRTYRELSHHIFRVAEVFIECTRGQELSPERIAADMPTGFAEAAPSAIAEYGEGVRREFARWWREAAPMPAHSLRTFYGEKPLSEVLERTVWHSGHHARQLRELLMRLGVEARQDFPDALLAGLPVPGDALDG
jgi:glutaredoxin/uncharacterized damage-inducible protein DinB